jgi:hypothetical protein
MSWVHTGKRPRYLAPPRNPKSLLDHEPDATYNPQGEWVCHRCGGLVKVVT